MAQIKPGAAGLSVWTLVGVSVALGIAAAWLKDRWTRQRVKPVGEQYEWPEPRHWGA